MYQVGDDHIRNSEAELSVETVDGSTAAKKEAPKTLHMLDIRECAIEQEYHYPPKTRGDRIAKKLVDYGEKLMHLFFREKVRRGGWG